MAMRAGSRPQHFERCTARVINLSQDHFSGRWKQFRRYFSECFVAHRPKDHCDWFRDEFVEVRAA